MKINLYNRGAMSIYQMRCGATRFEHWFGGPPVHQGTRLPGTKWHAFLLLTLDLADDRIGISLPGISTLPVYYAFYNQFSYELVSDEEIRIFGKPFVEREFYAKYRKGLPPLSMRLYRERYDPRNANHVECYGSLLGIGNLTKSERRHLEKQLRSIFNDEDGATLDDLVALGGGWAAFIGGEPCAVCPNTNCPNRVSGMPMKFFLELIPDEHDPWYYAAAGGDMGRVMVEICEACRIITVTNLCT